MNDREATVRSRTLAARLHHALKAKSWTGTALGVAMGWSQNRTSRFLSCKRAPDVLDVATALGHLGVRGTERDEILKLVPNLYAHSWWHERGDKLPARLPALSGQEQAATTITAFHPNQIPDLLQLPNYSRTLLRAGSVVHPDEVERHVALLAHRQTIIDRTEPPTLRFIVDQRTLTHSGVDRTAMAQQFHHILHLSNRPHIAIQMLPPSANLLLRYPPFTLLSFTDGRPAVYLEMLTYRDSLNNQPLSTPSTAPSPTWRKQRSVNTNHEHGCTHSPPRSTAPDLTNPLSPTSRNRCPPVSVCPTPSIRAFGRTMSAQPAPGREGLAPHGLRGPG